MRNHNSDFRGRGYATDRRPDVSRASQFGSDSEIHLHVAFVLLRRARGVQRNLRHRIGRLHEAILDQVLFDFLTANIGQHFAVNLNAGL